MSAPFRLGKLANGWLAKNEMEESISLTPLWLFYLIWNRKGRSYIFNQGNTITKRKPHWLFCLINMKSLFAPFPKTFFSGLGKIENKRLEQKQTYGWMRILQLLFKPLFHCCMIDKMDFMGQNVTENVRFFMVQNPFLIINHITTHL